MAAFIAGEPTQRLETSHRKNELMNFATIAGGTCTLTANQMNFIEYFIMIALL